MKKVTDLESDNKVLAARLDERVRSTSIGLGGQGYAVESRKTEEQEAFQKGELAREKAKRTAEEATRMKKRKEAISDDISTKVDTNDEEDFYSSRRNMLVGIIDEVKILTFNPNTEKGKFDLVETIAEEYDTNFRTVIKALNENYIKSLTDKGNKIQGKKPPLKLPEEGSLGKTVKIFQDNINKINEII